MRALTLMGVLSVLATGCSFTTAAGLDECQTSEDCASEQVCTQGFCLPLPTGCGPIYGSTDANAIQMGALFPLRTSTAPGAGIDESDEQALNAALLALDEVNQRGVGGKQIALHVCDTAGDTERTKTQATWLVNEKKVTAVLTAGSSQTLTASTVTIPKNVLTMSYSGSSTELTSVADTNGGKVGLLWRTSPSDAIQGSVIAHKLLTDSVKFGTPAKVAILYVDDPYGQGLYYIVSDRLNKVSKANRGISYARRGDVKTAVAQLNAYAPDVTVLVGFADDVTAIIKEASSQPNLLRYPSGKHRWFFSDSVKDAALLTNPEVYGQIQDFYGTAPAQGTGLAFSAFKDRFLGKYNKPPDGYAYISNAYDAMYLMALSAAYSQSTTNAVTGPKMAEALTKLSATSSEALPVTSFNSLVTELVAGRSVNVEGASGKLDFDANGEAPAPMELWQVKGGKFESIEGNLNPP
ncbi:ABC transporter substrate-binding protein [Archangium sp.]|jgi:branched-chain amino acid transport system substrate-binding protein|uniref:ABC transporter substrate-binding protein n=1 Tax=Archangium sp. TaxID=1872627 RepID=UPI002ED7FE29